MAIHHKSSWTALIAGLIVSSMTWAGGDYVGTSIQDAIQQTISSHPQVLGAKSREQAAQQDIRAAWGGYLPRVDLAGAIGWERSDNPATRATGRSHRDLTRKESNILLSQLLFDGWNVSNTVKQAKADRETARYQIAETQETLGFDAAQAYLDVIRHRNLVSIAAKEVSAHRITVDKVRRRLTAGAGRKSELALAQSRLALAESRHERARGRLLNANDTYIRVVGEAAPSHMGTPYLPSIPVSLDQAQSMAMEINPSIAAVDAEYTGRQAAVGVAKSAFYPRITADVSYSYNDQLDGVKGHNEDLNALLRGTYNIYRGGSDVALVRSAVFRKQDTQYAIEDVRRIVNEDVALAWNGLVTAKNRIPDLRSHRDKSREVLMAYRKQFKLGQRTLFDLLNAEIEYYDAWEALVDGQFDVRVQTYRLLSAMGNLVPTMFGAHDSVELQLAANHPRMKGSSSNTSVSNAASNGMKTHNNAVTSTSSSQSYGSSNPHGMASSSINTSSNLTGGGDYTIQLMAAHNPRTLDQVISRYHLGNKANYYPVNVKGQTWYRLTYGQYATAGEAIAAKQQLPAALQQMHPVVRSFRSVKSAT